MSRQDINAPGLLGLIRRAARLPPHLAVAKAARFAQRQLGVRRQRQSDLVNGTYLPLAAGMRWRSRFTLGPDAIAPRWHPILQHLGEMHRAHRFDILGSGPADAGYDAPLNPDRQGRWLADRVNASNLDGSRALWGLIDDEHYQPIDWQRDLRSGFRWRGDAHFTEQPIPLNTSADVKLPWEMGRLQHLPQLALCAILAKERTPGFGPADRYAREASNQLLDFLALNPPRFGVNWMCPMDVGIRVVNIIVSVELLHAAGLAPAQQIVDVVQRAIREHAEHILAHLEWSTSGRSNHYLANLVGLLWAAIYLHAAPRSNAMLAGAAAELLAEADLQFGDDGGNYEGSTNYHRLSGEFVLFGVALLAGLSDTDLARLDAAEPLREFEREGHPLGVLERWPALGGETAVPPALLAKLHRAMEMTRAATRPDGNAIQVGDTDSGRLLKLEPTGELVKIEGRPVYRENALSHAAFINAVEALFGVTAPQSIDAGAVVSIARFRTFARSVLSTVSDHGDLDAVISMIAELPESCRRLRSIPHPNGGSWQRAAFPIFGLYVFRDDACFIGFRCAPEPPRTAPLGHTHDDNLSIEYVIGDHERIDPGSYCYTPSLSLRDRYRSAAAHDVVRAVGWDLATPGPDPFSICHAAWATRLAWRPDGVAGEVRVPQGRLWRALRICQSCVEIWDGVSPPNQLRPISAPIPVSSGYGRLAKEGQAL